MRKLKLKEVKQFSQPESREAGNGMHVLRFQSHFIQKTQKFNEKGSAEKGGNCMVLELFIKKKKKPVSNHCVTTRRKYVFLSE